jgi:hypothetical protein
MWLAARRLVQVRPKSIGSRRRQLEASGSVRVLGMGMGAEKARLWWALAAAIGLQSFILYYQLNYGALVGLIPWDDCAIVLRALENLDKLAQAHSLWHMLGAALHLDIHAPVSDIQAIVGLLLAGGAIWGPYALNVTCLCIAIYAISTTAAKKDSIFFGTIVLFLLVQPVTFRALAEVKSDWQSSILLATALFLLFDAEDNHNNSRILGAALLGLMLVTKMTAFYLPVLALAVFLLFEFYGALKPKLAAKDEPNLSPAAWKRALASLGEIDRQRMICTALILVPYLLFFYYSHKALLPYIKAALGPIQRDGFTIPERLLFYSPLDGHVPPDVQGAVWGGLHFMFLIFLSAALIAALYKRAWLHVLACIGVLPLAAGFMAPLALAQASNITFGAPFFGTIIGGTLIFLRIFVANTPRWGALVAPIVVLALALPSTVPLSPLRDMIGTPLGRVELEHYRSINDDMVAAIVSRATSAQPEVVFTFDHSLMPYPNLSIRYFQRTGHFLSVYRIDDFSDPDDASLLANADFMVTITPTGDAHTVPNLPAYIPTSADPALGDARVRDSRRYGLITSYQVQGGEIRLYQSGASK